MTDETPTPEVPPQQQQRLPFDEDLQQRTKVFMQAALDAIPELEALAVTFSYGRLNTDLPYAVVFGQSGPLRTPTEIVHMSQQLWRTLNFQLQQGAEYVRQIDEHMGAKAKELQALQEQIDNAKRELNGLQVERDRRDNTSSPGAPGASNPESGDSPPG